MLFPTQIPETGRKALLKDAIIQKGEATGHAHKIEGDYEYFETLPPQPKDKPRRYLRLLRPGIIRHEEHKEITLPAGDYEIDTVREYDPFEEATRTVRD